MSDQPSDKAAATPTEPRAERLLVRTLAALAALTWPAATALTAAQATGATRFSAHAFGLADSWLVGVGCLSFGICMLRDDDPRIMRVLTQGLALGDPRLDGVLVPGPRRWRTQYGVRRALACVAACAWILAAIYTGQQAAGVYQVPLVAGLFTLILFLAAGIWTTVIVLAGAADARRELAYELACEAHALQRGQRERLASVAQRTPRDRGGVGGGEDAGSAGRFDPQQPQDPPDLRIVGPNERSAALFAPPPARMGRIRAALTGIDQ